MANWTAISSTVLPRPLHKGVVSEFVLDAPNLKVAAPPLICGSLCWPYRPDDATSRPGVSLRMRGDLNPELVKPDVSGHSHPVEEGPESRKLESRA